MFVDTVGDTIANLSNGFIQGWNQSLGYQSSRAFYQDPLTGQYYDVPVPVVPVVQAGHRFPFYPPVQTGGADWLPLLLIGGVLLFVIAKD